MKTQAIQSVKFLRLKRKLKLAHWQAVGILESLWLITQTNAPRGDIGRLSNDDMAAMIEWPGDADELVDGLVACGWLDRSDEYRLLVHDWQHHCPAYIRGSLSSQGIGFAGQPAEPAGELSPGLSPGLSPSLSPPAKPRAKPGGLAPPVLNVTGPDLTEPDQTKPKNPVRSGAPVGLLEPAGSDPDDDFRRWPELTDLQHRPSYPRPPNAGTLSHRGIFAPLQDHHLGEPQSMRAWLAKQAAAPAPLLEASPQSLVAVLALCEHVRAIPRDRVHKNRVAVFVNLASRHRWSAGRPFVFAALEQLQQLEEQESQSRELVTA